MLVRLYAVKRSPRPLQGTGGAHFRGPGEPRGPRIASLLPATQTSPSLSPLHLSVNEAEMEWGLHGGPRASSGGLHWAWGS